MGRKKPQEERAQSGSANPQHLTSSVTRVIDELGWELNDPKLEQRTYKCWWRRNWELATIATLIAILAITMTAYMAILKNERILKTKVIDLQERSDKEIRLLRRPIVAINLKLLSELLQSKSDTDNPTLPRLGDRVVFVGVLSICNGGDRRLLPIPRFCVAENFQGTNKVEVYLSKYATHKNEGKLGDKVSVCGTISEGPVNPTSWCVRDSICIVN